VTAFDINPAQLAHVRAKAEAVARGDLAALNVEDTHPGALNQCGHFEGLFRVLRHFLIEFVLTERELAGFFDEGTPHAERLSLVDRWTRSPYWPAAFAVTFTDGFLHAMFGPAATQHAEPGSYPGYFQRVFERGLRHEQAARNPFLQHVLLGCYWRDTAPPYVHAGRELAVDLVEGSLTDVPELGRFEVISLSNVFDWSDDALVTRWARRLVDEAKPGCAILVRQLNNRRDLRRFFSPAFTFDDALSAAFLAQDRSLFYERFEVGFHTGRR
jgi:S-adenosylmethionine-diacylglycerol 3-amino-3-carboxypropyl transferase